MFRQSGIEGRVAPGFRGPVFEDARSAGREEACFVDEGFGAVGY